LAEDVHRLVDLVARNPAIQGIALVGSRADDDPTPLSDWDLEVTTDDFQGAAVGIIEAAAALKPLAVFFDPLGTRPNLTVILDGPTKVDLIFPDTPFEPAPPWEATGDTLTKIDWHFWDWTLWLAAKRLRGLDDIVDFSIEDQHEFLLRPMGVEQAPESLDAAMDAYEDARAKKAAELGMEVDPTLGQQVRAAIAAAADP
jgi:predicted nucleotidyltransferase